MTTYREFIKKDSKKVSLLVTSVYEQFCKNETSSEFLTIFKDILDPKKHCEENLFNKIKREFTYVAKNENKIIGIIVSEKGRIKKLFVDGDYHHKGIASHLLKMVENDHKKFNINEIKIRSSIYALPFYQKHGYKKTTGIRCFNGMKNFPLKKKLS